MVEGQGNFSRGLIDLHTCIRQVLAIETRLTNLKRQERAYLTAKENSQPTRSRYVTRIQRQVYGLDYCTISR